jgi:hypothetical protein
VRRAHAYGGGVDIGAAEGSGQMVFEVGERDNAGQIRQWLGTLENLVQPGRRECVPTEGAATRWT